MNLVENIKIMPTLKHQEFDGGDPPPRRRSYELWFLQRDRDRDRYYVRLTALGVLAALLLTLIPIAAILTFYFIRVGQQARELEKTNTDIIITPVPTGTPITYPPAPVLRLPPVPTPQLRAEDLKAALPTPVPTPDDAVEQPTRRPTPRPTRPSTPPPAPSSSPPPSPTPP